MTNKEKFLKLVSKEKTNTIERVKERILKRKQQNIMEEITKEIYKGYSIEPADTIYSPNFKIVNINDCDDFVRYANTLDEAKTIINELSKN